MENQFVPRYLCDWNHKGRLEARFQVLKKIGKGFDIWKALRNWRDSNECFRCNRRRSLLHLAHICVFWSLPSVPTFPASLKETKVTVGFLPKSGKDPTFFFFFQIFFRVAQGAQILGTWSPGRLNCARLRTVFNYCSLSLAYEDACQFIYPEEKVPHNSEVRRSLQNFESLVLKSLHPSGVYNFGEARRFLENLWTLGLASYPLLINSSKEVKPIGKLLLARRWYVKFIKAEHLLTSLATVTFQKKILPHI